MNKQEREINFNPQESNFSGVADLNDILFPDTAKSEEQKFEDKFDIEKVEEEEDSNEEIVDTKGEAVEFDLGSEEDESIKQPDSIQDTVEEEQEVQIEESTTSIYRDIVKELFEGYDTIIVEEEGEEVEKSLDDIDLDKETFLDMVKSKFEEIETKANEGKVTVTDVSDLTKKIIDIDKSGGNVKEALEVYETFQDPTKDLDLSIESDQEQMIIYKERLIGTSDEQIAKKLKFFKYDESLEEEAVQAKKFLDTEAKKRLDAIEENAVKQREFEKEALKKYRKDLSSSLDSFELKPSYKKHLLDISSKKNEEGRYELDDLYSKVRANPEESAELILFLANKEEYLKQKLKPELINKQVETQKKFKLARRSSSKSQVLPKNNNSEEGFIDIEDLPK